MRRLDDAYARGLAASKREGLQPPREMIVGGVGETEFTNIVLALVGKGLLVEAEGAPDDRSILDLLSPQHRSPNSLGLVTEQLALGRFIVLRNAFAEDFADKMFRSLDTCEKWQPEEDFSKAAFSRRHHNIYNDALFPVALSECRKLFSSAKTKEFIEKLSGRDCGGETAFSASRYFPGDYSLPHDDTRDHRTVAFVWHLTKDWEPQWGGGFYWCASSFTLAASYNTLVVFSVSARSLHFVTQVSPYARGKRIAINGWWRASDPEQVGRGSPGVSGGGLPPSLDLPSDIVVL